MIEAMAGVILLFLAYIVGKALGYQDGHSDGFIEGSEEREEYEDPAEKAAQAEQEQFFLAQVQAEFSKVYGEINNLNETLTNACVDNANDIKKLEEKIQEQVRH